MGIKEIPLWQKNFQIYEGKYGIIQFVGNIDDLVPKRGITGLGMRYMYLDEWLWEYYKNNCIVVYYSPLSGFYNFFDRTQIESFKQFVGNSNSNSFSGAVDCILEAFKNTKKRIIVIFDKNLRMCTERTALLRGPEGHYSSFIKLKSAAESRDNLMHHQIILITGNTSIDDSLPSLITEAQATTKELIISRPDQLQREYYLEWQLRSLGIPKNDILKIAQSAEGFMLKEIDSALRNNLFPGVTSHKIIQTIKLFALGCSEDPWELVDNDTKKNADQLLSDYVIGQEEAVRAASLMIRAAASNTASVFQEDGRQEPKGVLFFCGLPGTGKTELAKAIARVVFGSADSMIRFDMGEYNLEQSAERLVGSPPGYIGHEAGGQLTEAVREHPFSVLLFDEIDKAHPTVMNKFLSILEDGRLTDGKGRTVSFSNTIIIFTSNIGASLVDEADDKEKVKKEIETAVENHFKHGIKRPELYSRLAGNIIVFNSLDNTQINLIFERYLQKLCRQIGEGKQINFSVTDTCKNKIKDFVDKERAMNKYPGGRGMKKLVDKYFKVPLIIFFDGIDCRIGQTMTITDIKINNGVPSLIGRIE